jgi:hypothetical protein
MQNDTTSTVSSVVSIGSYVAAVNIITLQKIGLFVAILSGVFSIINIARSWIKKKEN